MIVLNHPACDQETRNRAEKLLAEFGAQLALTEIEAIKAQAMEETPESIVEELLKK